MLNRKNIKNLHFYILYFLTILFLLLDTLNNVPLTEMLRKFKYVYLVIMGVYWMKSVMQRKLPWYSSGKIFALFFLHSGLFGYVFVNEIVLDYTHKHAQELIIAYLFVFVTTYYINTTKCLYGFAITTFLAQTIHLGYAAITHLNNFVNPIYFVNVFSSSDRFRFNFGFVQYGYTANYCTCAILVSLLIFDFWRRNNQLKKIHKPLFAILTIDFFVLCMLGSTAGRSGILTVMLVLGLYFYNIYFENPLHADKRKLYNKYLIIAILLFIIIAGVNGIWESIWSDSNRELNIEVNYPIFKELGNEWIGMGYVPNESFRAEADSNYMSIFGYRTSSLDMYYVYLYFTTGILGCILIGLIVLLLMVRYIRCIDKPQFAYAFSLFAGWLFYTYWQCNLFGYRYYTSLIYLIILLTIYDSVDKKELINDN